MDYFTLFNIPKKFKINKNTLSKNYYRLQLQFHPDLFINYSESQKKMVLEKTIEINKGYKILKNFSSRATYLLYLNGYKIKKENMLLKNNIALIKYFSLYEELDDLKKNSFNKKQLNSLLYKIEEKTENCKKQIEIEFEKKKFEKVLEMLAKLLFLKKIKLNLKKEQNQYLRHTN